MRVLVHGLAIAGAATVRALHRRGHDVVVTDDAIDPARRDLAAELGVALEPLSDLLESGRLADIDAIVPAPGVPESHRLFRACAVATIPVLSEIELAYRWEQERGDAARPILAVTGTDGKTTTTELTVAILEAAGRRAVAVGNTDVPFVEAVDDDTIEVFVVECTSFRLAFTERFRADAAVWLNLAPDHLNWHASMATYESAKARIFELQQAGDVAIGFADDERVMAHLRRAPGRQRSFGSSDADYRVDGDRLVGPAGPIVPVSSMRRSLPHDRTNALAAAALVIETGLAGSDAIDAALRSFEAPPHRLEPIGEWDGVAWFNDSKATTPHAAATAIRAFDSLVLIAGGSRKGVDLSPMGAEPGRLRGVVAIGEAASDIRAVFADITTVTEAESMEDAVSQARAMAERGDAVVLSPGCASFDWYTGYPARGDDFRKIVHALFQHEPDRH